MRQSYLILYNAVIIWASRVLSLLPQLILVPYLIATIGEVGYGVYALVWSLLMGIDQLEKNLQQGVIKYSAAYLAQGHVDEVNRVVSSSSVYSLLLGAMASIGIIGGAITIGHPSSELSFCLLVVGVLVFFIMPLSPYVAIIQSQQRYYVEAIAGTLSRYVSLVLIFCFFSLLGASVQMLIIIMAVTLFLSRLAQVPVAYRLVKGLQNDPRLFDRNMFRLIVTFGGMSILIGLAGIANTTGLRWMMGILVSTSFVAHLAIMLMPGMLLTQVVHAMTLAIMPAASTYEATGKPKMLQLLLLRGMRYTTIIVLASLFVATILMDEVLEVWVGAEYVFLAPYTLIVLAGVALRMTVSTAHHLLKGMGRMRSTAFTALTSKMFVPLGTTAIAFFVSEDPYLSVVVGLTAGNLLWTVLHISYGAKAVKVSLREICVRVYVQPILAATAVATVVIVLSNVISTEGFLARAVLASSAVLSLLLLVYFFVAEDAERQQAREIAQALLSRARALGHVDSR